MTITRDAIQTLLTLARNEIFRISFIKKDGSIRHLVGRKGVTKGVKGVGNKVTANHSNYITVFGMKEGFRTVNLDTVFEVKIDGFVYTVA